MGIKMEYTMNGQVGEEMPEDRRGMKVVGGGQYKEKGNVQK